MAKSKARLAPLSSKLAEDERAKHTRKTAQDEWNVDTTPSPNEVLAAIEAQKENIDQADPELVKRIWETARELYRKLKEIAKLTAELEDATAEVRRLQETVLPDMLSQAQTKELTSETGVKLEKKDKVYASISKENEGPANAWLEKQGFGALIRSSFEIPLDKGDTKTRKLLRALLKKAKVAFAEKSSVHHQTLLAFVRESIEKARQLPESIKYHVQPIVEIKLPKTKKTTDKFVSDSNDINL